MRSTTKTRVQRRIEKKQALMLVALVLVISVVSFVLGVVVGRHSGEPRVVQQASAPRRIIVDDNLAAPADQPPAEAQPQDEKLTFYDNLSKDEVAPIGSGINLPPAAELPEVVGDDKVVAVVDEARGETALVASPAVAPVRAVESVPTPVSSPVSTQVVDQLPAPTKGGDWVVQVFSSQSAADAGMLRDKLGGKGYPAFIAEADLGPKGIWYRVLIGPYADKSAAVQAQTYAGKKDKLTGFAKRR